MEEQLQDRVRAWPGWVVGWALLDDDMYGTVDFERSMIWLDIRLDEREARSTLAVELERRDRGPFADDECMLEQAAARWLIPFDDLAAAVSMAREPEGVACILGVDMQLLRVRQAGLTMDERQMLLAASGGPAQGRRGALDGNDRDAVP